MRKIGLGKNNNTGKTSTSKVIMIMILPLVLMSTIGMMTTVNATSDESVIYFDRGLLTERTIHLVKELIIIVEMNIMKDSLKGACQ